MTITLILTEAVVNGLREETTAPREYAAVVEAVGRYDGSIIPMHPGESDPYLARFFNVEVPDPDQADDAAEALSDLDGVEAAYVKPADALP